MGEKRILYYLDRRGRNLVLDEIRRLVPSEQRKIDAHISFLQESGEELRRPIADYVGDKRYELRPGPHRVLYFFFLRDNAVLLHLFRKRTDRLPDEEKRVALSRMTDFIRRVERGEGWFGEGK